MGRKSKIEDASHKQKLTLAELAGHDDVCSDVMIDNVRDNTGLIITRLLT